MATAQAFGSFGTHHGISDLAATQFLVKPRRRNERTNRAGHGSSGKRRSRRRKTLGRSSRNRRACLRCAQTQRHRLRCLLIWNRRPSEGLHDDARKLFGAVRRPYVAVSVLAGRALPQYFADEPRHRFYGWFFWAVHLRRRGRAFAHAASRICARSFSKIQNHLRESGSSCLEKSAEGPASAFRCASTGQTQDFQRARWREQSADKKPSASRNQPTAAQASSRSVWRRASSDHCWRRLQRTPDAAIFLRPWDSCRQWIRTYGSGHGDHGQRFETVSRGHRRQAASGHGSADSRAVRGRRRRSRCPRQNRHGRLLE